MGVAKQQGTRGVCKWMEAIVNILVLILVEDSCFNYVIQEKWVNKYVQAYIYINKEGYALTKSENIS